MPTPEGPVQVTPDVRLLSSAGRLVLGVSVAEDPGSPIGVHLMVAPAKAASAADAASIDVRPVELRAPRFAARGPKGAGLSSYRVEGRADTTRVGAWSLEVGVPWVDLAAAKDAPLRIALVVYTRTPGVIATWPAGALWRSPAHWQAFAPPADGWRFDVQVDPERIQRDEVADRAHLAAWLAYLKGTFKGIDPRASRTDVLAAFQRQVVTPLEAVIEHRADLEVPARCLLGGAYQRLGLWPEAEAAYERAVALAPGWREARFGLHLKVRAQRMAEGEAGAASDYGAAFAAIEEAARKAQGPWDEQAARLGRALLQVKHGDFAAALPVIEAVARAYPFDVLFDAVARQARAGRSAAAQQARVGAGERGVVRPQAVVKTSRGTFVFDMFPNEARNTVRNFVWLGRHGFYDGLAVHRTVPFFLMQAGDPHSRAGDAEPGAVGTGTCGYAIASERTKRRMLRGAVVMAAAGPDTESSQFYVLTGSAMHLQGDQTVFGQVRSGQEVVEALRVGDRIESVTFRDLDAEERYVPITVAGVEPKKPAKSK